MVTAASFQSVRSRLKFQFVTYGVLILRFTPSTGHGLYVSSGTYEQGTALGERSPKIGPPACQLVARSPKKVRVVALIVPGEGMVFPWMSVRGSPVGISASPCASVLFCPMKTEMWGIS